MKGLTFVILLISLHTAAQINPNINQFDKQGKKHGKWKGYNENKQSKRYEGEFNHGAPVGRFTYYAKEGYVSGKVDFINDSISNAQMFHENGSIMAEGKFLNQTKSGKWYIYSRTGYLLNAFHYINGALEGTQYSYYPKFDDYEEIKVMEQYECKGGLKNGVWKSFHKLGTVKAEGNYVEGNKEGVFTYYFINGSIEMKGAYERDLREGEWFFYNGETANMNKVTYLNGEIYEIKK
jgi:antitoxin component YwqK of YwqJK toxin-antitoxin module